MKSNEAAIRKLIGETKTLRARRKAYNKAVKDGKSTDAATIGTDIAKREAWFRKEYPELNIATIVSLNAIIRDANNTLKITTAPAESRRKTREMIDTASMMPASDGSGTTTISKTRKKPTTVRRHPAKQIKA